MIHGGVAQLVRATACHAVGHRFESGRPRPEPERSSVLGWPESNLKNSGSSRPGHIKICTTYIISEAKNTIADFMLVLLLI